MSGGFEPAVVAEWLFSTLSDVDWDDKLPGGWHRRKAPAKTPYPYGSYHMHAPAADTTSTNRTRILTNALWLVRATGIAGDSDANLDTIAVMIDDALDRASGTAGTGRVYMATRETPWDRDYVEGGVNYVEVG